MLDGSPVASATGPIVWGEPGTNGQHAFYQLIHQGTNVIPCEFLVAAYGHEPALEHHHQLLLANCLAQSEALMRGPDAGGGAATVKDPALAPHKVFPGNRPSTTLIYPTLDPATLGRIIALYEHRVFVEGVIWGINSFDQWGVELGKELATALLPLVETRAASAARTARRPGCSRRSPRCGADAATSRRGAEPASSTPTSALLVLDKPSGLLSVPAKPPGPRTAWRRGRALSGGAAGASAGPRHLGGDGLRAEPAGAAAPQLAVRAAAGGEGLCGAGGGRRGGRGGADRAAAGLRLAEPAAADGLPPARQAGADGLAGARRARRARPGWSSGR